MLVSEMEQRFWAAVPRPFMERVLRSLFDNYRLTDEIGREFGEPEKANLRPFYRRALIERSLRTIANQFPDWVTAASVRFDDKGFWYHTRVICKNDVALTQNTVPDPDILVRNSCFRNCYAGPNNQTYLFSEMAPERLPPDSLLYGIIVHGRSPESRLYFPGFAQVRFPKPGLIGYYDAKVNLFDEFAEVVEEKTTALPRPQPEEMETEPELLDPMDMRDGFGT